MNHSILTNNQKLRLDIRLPMLLCFAMYGGWQMGIIYFSGTSLSVDGRTPLPVSVESTTIFIAAGYILGIAVMLLIPRITVWVERISVCFALLSALALFLPLSPEALTYVIYFHIFICCFMIIFESAIVINLLTEKSTLLFFTVGYPVANTIGGLLQNDFIPISFDVFRLAAVIMLAFLLVFFFRLPTNVWPRYAKKSDGLVRPGKLFAGVYLLAMLACFMILFGTAVAENTTHGVFTNYIASSVGGLALFLLWKFNILLPLRGVSVLIALGSLGFILAIVSLYAPAVSLIACALLGAANMTCWLNPFWALLLAKRYPSRFITPIIIGIAFGTVLIQSALLEAFRENTQLLYVVYLLIAVALAIVYLVLEPYLLHTLHDRPLITKERESAGDSALPKTDFLRNAAFDALTDTELMIAERVLRGYSNKEIGAELGYSESTIKTYRKNLYSKLQIHSPRELFLLAERGYPDRRGGDEA